VASYTLSIRDKSSYIPIIPPSTQNQTPFLINRTRRPTPLSQHARNINLLILLRLNLLSRRRLLSFLLIQIRLKTRLLSARAGLLVHSIGDLALTRSRHLLGFELDVPAIVFLRVTFGFFAGRRAADAVGYGGRGCVAGGGGLVFGGAFGTGNGNVSSVVFLERWLACWMVDTHTGAFFAAEAFSLAWTFSAGSLVAGFPGVA
jgi:hypothetical protein